MNKINILIVIILSQLLLNCTSNSVTDASTPSNDWNLVSSTDSSENNSLCSLGNTIFIGTKTKGVYRSTDNGATWVQVNNGIVDTKLCVVDNINGTLYLSTTKSITVTLPTTNPYITKIYKSTNNGDTWIPIWNNLPTISAAPKILFLNNLILIGIGTKIIKSIDNGVNWNSYTVDNIGLMQPVNSLVSDGTNIFCTDNQFGDLYKSTDNGSTFTQIPMSSYNCGPYGFVYSVGTKLFYGGSNNIIASISSANSWSNFNSGLESGIPNYWNSIYSMYSDGSKLYAGSNDRVYMSDVNNPNWSSVGGNLGTNNVGVETIAKNNTTYFALNYNGELYSYPIQ